MFDANKRQNPRAYFPCQLTIWLADGSDETVMANTANLGTGGLCVHVNQEILIGTKVDIQLSFTGTTTPFRCNGKVVRCKQESDKVYNIGIQFEPLSELKMAFLQGKVSEIIEKEKKGPG